MDQAMDPTALVTFLFRAPPEACAVELLGSWDNFTLPYRMHHDRRRGHGFWSGCFKFENITFDGTSLPLSRPRAGGLRQGSTYYYFYRLNYDVDAYDDARPITTLCPFLPGQIVNVIHVPVEIVEMPRRCHSAYSGILATLTASEEAERRMDPNSKYHILEPPPKSKVHKHCLSDEMLNGRLQNQPTTHTEETRPSARPIDSSHRFSDEPLPVLDEEVYVETLSSDDSTSLSPYEDHDDVASVIDEYQYEDPSDVTERGRADFDELDDGLDPLEHLSYPDVLGPTPLPVARWDSVLAHEQDTGTRRAQMSNPTGSPHHRDPSNTQPATRGHAVTFSTESRPLSERSMGPQSVQNVQFYGSRPASVASETPFGFRQRIHSVPNFDLLEHVVESSPASPTAASSSSQFSATDQDEIPTPYQDADSLDLTSPSFSATTVSTGGQNSPFRLSATLVPTPSSRPTSATDPATLDDGVSTHLRFLTTNTTTTAATIKSSLNTRPRLPARARSFLHRITPHALVNYSLPACATASTHSLAKTSSHQSAPRTATTTSTKEAWLPLPLPLPTVVVAPHDSSAPGGGSGAASTSSMVEAIFSELGYLGSSIA